MNMMRAIIGGFAGGIIGGLLWAGISFWTGYEIGWIAWGIGALVGFGCVKGARGGGVSVAVLGTVITALSIAGGKFGAVEFSIAKYLGSQEEIIAKAVAELQNEETVVSYLAHQTVEALDAAGRPVAWPEGIDPAEAFEEAHYPPEIWASAKGQWQQMSEADRASYRRTLGTDIRKNVEAWYSEVSMMGFTESFTPMDLLFFGLGVFTAFQLAMKAPPATMASTFAAEEPAEASSPIASV